MENIHDVMKTNGKIKKKKKKIFTQFTKNSKNI